MRARDNTEEESAAECGAPRLRRQAGPPAALPCDRREKEKGTEERAGSGAGSVFSFAIDCP
jgi:hypothetical protein